jgi:hypothetical protein
MRRASTPFVLSARARWAALLLLGALFGVVAACSTSQAPLGQGDDIISDIDASDASQPQQQGDDGPYDDGYFARADAGYGPPPDGYAPFNWCTQCGCPADTFCFGGGTGFSDFSGTCHAADAGALDGAAALAIGCYPYPTACATDPTCDCIIAAVSQYIPCYAVCSITTNTVYCPNP